jgi:hypothetical protein
MNDFDELVRGRKRDKFKLGGQTFTIRANLHARRFARMLRVVEGIEGAEDAIDATVKFMDKVLIPEDRERFHAIMSAAEEDDDSEDDATAVTLEQINEVVDWTVEHYTGKRPTREESSTPGAESTETPQNVVSFNPVKNQAS